MYSFMWFCLGALTMFVAVVAWLMWGLLDAGENR